MRVRSSFRQRELPGLIRDERGNGNREGAKGVTL